MSDVALRLRGITKTYNRGSPGAVEVLRGVDMSLDAGEVVALVAPSGAGKSTLLHIAGLLDTPDGGTVEIAAQDVRGQSDRRRTTLRRDQSAAENIVLPQLAAGTSRADADARAMDLLDSVGVSQRAHHRPAELSGGEQQRVAFCRALANRPSVLLADEPTGNLDPATSDTVFDALMTLVRDTGLAALIATHNLDLAARMDRQLRLDQGVLTPA